MMAQSAPPDSRERWVDADASGLKRVHRATGNTIEVVGERAVSWIALPSLLMRARFGDIAASFALDRDSILSEIGPRQTVRLTILQRVLWSEMSVTIGSAPSVVASSLDQRTWQRLEGFLIDALSFWPGIGNTYEQQRLEHLKEPGMKGAHGAFERFSDYDYERINEVASKPLFYGGWREGCWNDLLLKSVGGLVNAPWDWTFATGKEQRALAERESPDPDWRLEGPPTPLITQVSSGRSLAFLGNRRGRLVTGRTFPGKPILKTWPRTTLYSHFEYRADDGAYPLSIDLSYTLLPAPVNYMPSWRIDFTSAAEGAADMRHSEDFFLDMQMFVQDALLNWRQSELVFGEKYRGPPIYLHFRNALTNGSHRGHDLQIVRSSKVLRAFRD